MSGCRLQSSTDWQRLPVAPLGVRDQLTLSDKLMVSSALTSISAALSPPAGLAATPPKGEPGLNSVSLAVVCRGLPGAKGAPWLSTWPPTAAADGAAGSIAASKSSMHARGLWSSELEGRAVSCSAASTWLQGSGAASSSASSFPPSAAAPSAAKARLQSLLWS